MGQFEIDDRTFDALKDSVIVLTGGSSGIGLGTATLLLEHGAKVVAGDRDASPLHHANLTSVRCDVTRWRDLVALFDAAAHAHGRVDHVFANAGIAGALNFADDDFDESGAPLEPAHAALRVNLVGAMNTVKLALHHLKQNPAGGSIVLTASTAAFQRFSSVEYTTAKHGVLGLMRGLAGHTHPHTAVRVRVNAVAPSWTDTPLVPREALIAAGIALQTPRDAARSVAVLMADPARNQQLVYSVAGVYTEVEADLLEAADRIRPKDTSEDDDLRKVMNMAA